MGVGPKGNPWKKSGISPRSTGRKLKSHLAVSNDPAFDHPQKDYSKIGRDTETYTPYGIGSKEKTSVVSYNLNRTCGYCGTRIHDKKQVEFCTFNCYSLHLKK